jgi:hypothetical protein
MPTGKSKLSEGFERELYTSVLVYADEDKVMRENKHS